MIKGPRTEVKVFSAAEVEETFGSPPKIQL
jgi:hypothetical protein